MIPSPLPIVGGKSKMLHRILPYIPRVNHVVEPFAGGLSVGLNVAARGIAVSAYDIDVGLVSFWQALATQPIELVGEICSMMPMTKERFAAAIEELKSSAGLYRRAAAYYVVRRYSWASLGAAGGASPRRNRLSLRTAQALLKTDLRGVTIEKLDFRETLERHAGDFVYLDPPYLFEEDKANNLYGERGENHRSFPHIELFELLKDRRGWLLSYGSNQTIRELYAGFPMTEFVVSYTGAAAKAGHELLIFPRVPQ